MSVGEGASPDDTSTDCMPESDGVLMCKFCMGTPGCHIGGGHDSVVSHAAGDCVIDTSPVCNSGVWGTSPV